ncbi:protein SHORTAGE IN CHIASMATA 1 [Phalaenopsis equestris]|uniref:protein SHORTAGE IN CHIASMATA 1 n=1 Tax=Phalaenopsis equestris TaxID=78828 RepID=UPI0009E4D623|nr:protein SHORTAGE IN CHIASMATA 1 [Phalaenopsis equestris]
MDAWQDFQPLRSKDQPSLPSVVPLRRRTGADTAITPTGSSLLSKLLSIRLHASPSPCHAVRRRFPAALIDVSMRTRFLATDYFSAPSTTESLKDFQVIPLPAPNFFSPDLFHRVEIPLLVPDRSVQHEIDRFPFEEAITDFLSDVIPRFLDAEGRRSSHGSTGSQFNPSSENNNEEIGYASCEMKCIEGVHGSFYNEMEVEDILDIEYAAFNHILPELGVSCEDNEDMLFFEIHGISVPLDFIDVKMEISIATPFEVERMLCLIEDVPDILILGQENFSAKDGKFSQDKRWHDIKLPIFEIGESVFGIHESMSMDEIFNDLLAYQMPQKNDDELVVNAKDFLGTTNDNFLKHFLNQEVSEYDLDNKLLPLNSLLELDLINLNGCILFEKQSVIYQTVSDESSQHIPCLAQFEEVQVLDGTINVPDMFNSFESVEEEGFSEQMCKEEVGQIENFYDSVLTSELSLTDDPFKFLPAPILSDDRVLKSKSRIVEDIFNALKPHTFSVSDELYLDWHPLLEGGCNNEACSTFLSMVQEVSSYRIETSELISQYDSFMHSDFDFLDDSLVESSTAQCKELPDVHQNSHDDVVPAVDTVVTEKVNDDNKQPNGAKQIPKKNPANISLVLESISQSNDLNFFLGVRKGGVQVSSCFETLSANKPSIRITSGDELEGPSETSLFSASNIEKIELHKASLSGYTLSLIDQIKGIYFSNLNNCRHLITNSSLSTPMELLSIPKGRLLELISEKGGSRCTLGARDEPFVALLAIYALKQLAYYLCFFGIHIAYLYVSCSSKVDNLAERLQPLQSLLQDALWKAEKQILESHPSLSLIEGLLRSNASKGFKKTLIISNEVFWPSLKHKLTSLNISFNEVRNPCPEEQLDILDNCTTYNSILEELSHSDCLLLSYENTSASFPFNMFSSILEYGGPRSISIISEIFPCLGSIPCVHFIRFDVENHYVAKALCEGFEASNNSMIFPNGFPSYMTHLQGCLNDQNTEGIFTQFPLHKACNNSCEPVLNADPSHDNECAMNMLYLSSSNKTTAKVCSDPETVIIVNTLNLEKNMIISRRSSYQKILELEKSGVQVAERDINLPLDLIFSAAVCLVWYEAINIVDKTEAVVSFSAIPAFIENIATKILMSLSSSFSGCILIFEGERNFLASIMESSDMLYAAAASLDLNLQLFCSHTPENTDDIILNCIRMTSTKDGGLHSAMPESESIAESFLTKFPSINPLSAHSILSSGGMLVEFFEWSPERRIQAIGKYKVPHGSISLFNALCRYGELGESKSVMTDCSSIDSENTSGTLQSKRKKKIHEISYGTPGMLVGESFYVEPSQLYHSSNVIPQPSQPYQSKIFRPRDVPKEAQLFSNANILEGKQELNNYKMSNIGGDTLFRVFRHSNPHDEFHNDVFDYNCNFLNEPFASIPRSRFNPRTPDLRSEPMDESFLSSSRFLGGQSRTFPTSAEINCSENDLTKFCKKNGSEKESEKYKSSLFNKELITKRKNFLHQNQKYTPGLLNKTKGVPYLGEFLRSTVSQPSQQKYRQKSIIESVGQANERSKMHQQFSCNTCLSCPGSLKRKAVCQKKSPSIIDSFRYQGGNKNVQGTVNERKNLTRVQPSPRDLDKMDSAFIIPSWTPIDKRARQQLSFVRTGNEQQRRLAWRRSESPRVGFGSRKRQRGDV